MILIIKACIPSFSLTELINQIAATPQRGQAGEDEARLEVALVREIVQVGGPVQPIPGRERFAIQPSTLCEQQGISTPNQEYTRAIHMHISGLPLTDIPSSQRHVLLRVGVDDLARQRER
jgi:hypothetical protein